MKCVSSATENMSALIDDIIKKARKNFKQNGKPEVDAKFLKESVGALKELYELLAEYGIQDFYRKSFLKNRPELLK